MGFYDAADFADRSFASSLTSAADVLRTGYVGLAVKMLIRDWLCN
jgi:hypothetical protein